MSRSHFEGIAQATPWAILWVLWGLALWMLFPPARELFPLWLGLPLPLFVLATTPPERILPGGPLPILATPLALTLLLALPARDDGWLYDDPCLLVSILRHGSMAHFVDPAVWRPLSGNVLMPWTLLSFDLDLTLFGPQPSAFYLHHLISFGLLLTLLSTVLRRRLPPLPTALALTAFTGSAAAVGVLWRLMNRHYLEGTVLAACALVLYHRSLEEERDGPACWGAGLFLLATTAKEIFVPLVVLLPLWPIANLHRRLRSTVPYALVAGLYGLWRLYLLGPSNSLSGYATPGQGTLESMPRILGLGHPLQLILVAGLLLFAVTGIRRWGLVVPATAAVLVAPLVPVVDRLEPRHFFVPSLVLALALAYAARHLSQRHPMRVLALGLGLVLFTLNALYQTPVWQNRPTALDIYNAEGSFVLDSPERGVLLTTLEDTAYLGCMAELRQITQGDAGPGYCGDPCYCAGILGGIETFERRGASIVEVEPPPLCAIEQALEVELSYEPLVGRLSWRLGPYSSTEGQYFILLLAPYGDPGVSVPFPLPPDGETPFTLERPLRSILSFESHEGWRTYSPPLTIEPEAFIYQWSRPTANPPGDALLP